MFLQPTAPVSCGVMRHNRGVMFDRLRAKAAARREQAAALTALEQALCDFAESRSGVAAWVEQATGFNKSSILLIAATGEWMRKAIPDTDWGRDFAAAYQLTCYTAGVDPYPQRMRDWDAAHRKPAIPDGN